MIEVVDRLLPLCASVEEEDLDFDELVSWAIEIIDQQLKEKRFE